MATLKRQKAGGTWEFVQVVGSDFIQRVIDNEENIGDISSLVTDEKSNIVGALNEIDNNVKSHLDNIAQ